MKKIALSLLAAILFSTLIFAQKGKVTTASIQLQNGEVMKAKESIDQAFSDPEVEAMSKSWLIKGDIYKNIYETNVYFTQVPDALFVAEEAYRKAYELDLLEKGKKKGEISTNLSNLSIYLYNQGVEFFKNEDYEVALKNFKTTMAINDFQIKNTMTTEVDTNAILLTSYSYINSGKAAQAKPLLEQLIKLNVRNANPYVFLVDILKSENASEEKVVSLINSGLKRFPNDEALKIAELNYYISKGEAGKMITKLEEAIAKDPKNPAMYFALGTAYEQMNDKENAGKAYDNAITVNANYFEAYFNYGAMYYNEGIALNKKMNEMADWKAAQKMEPQRDALYSKSLPYFEKAYSLKPSDNSIKIALKEIYARMNMLDKLEGLK